MTLRKQSLLNRVECNLTANDTKGSGSGLVWVISYNLCRRKPRYFQPSLPQFGPRVKPRTFFIYFKYFLFESNCTKFCGCWFSHFAAFLLSSKNNIFILPYPQCTVLSKILRNFSTPCNTKDSFKCYIYFFSFSSFLKLLTTVLVVLNYLLSIFSENFTICLVC
jgi:hypothetical protein